MTIIFIMGLRGSGKSTVGKLLASELKYKHYDQDKLFYEKHGAISKFVKNYGWEVFYTELFEILKDIKGKNIVVSGGGSIFMKDEQGNIDLKKVSYCKKRGILIMLSPSKSIKKSAKILYERFKCRNKRIFGNNLETQSFNEFFIECKNKYPKYKDNCDVIFFDSVSEENMTKKIINYLREESIII